MTPPLLEATGLMKQYGSIRALRSVDVRVEPGESLAIMGTSGSGKSTLLHCLAGIVRPDGGRVLLRDARGPMEVSDLSETKRSELRRRRFGFVFQQGLLLPELTAIENVALPLLLGGVRRRDAESKADARLTALGLGGLGDRRIGELSGGQAHRVAIARALVTDPAIVFADEPTGALDSATSADVLDTLILTTCGAGRGLVVVTHDHEVARRCSRVMRLRDGALESTGLDTESRIP